MLNEKPWTAESVLRLLLWLFASIGTAAIAVSLAFPHTEAGTERRTWSMIAGSLAFHGSAIACVAVFVRTTGLGWRAAFGFGEPRGSRAVLAGIVAGAAILPVAIVLGQLSSLLMASVDVEPVSQVSVRTLQTATSLPLKLYFGVVAVLMAPVAEELLFRGVLYPTIKQRGYPRLALWGTSLLFAATHANVMTFVPLTVLALVLVRLYEHTGNLLAPITAHSLFNLANFVWLLVGDEPRL